MCHVARRLGTLALCAGLALSSSRASAQAAPPAAHEDAAFDFMNLMAQSGLHDLQEERWNAYGQFTYISSWKLPFSAAYTNVGGSTKSLIPDAERGFTGTFTLFFGLKLWKGSGAYLVPEVVAERPLSGLQGIGGAIQNFELQKTGSETPQLYRSRAFLRQTLNFGGEKITHESDPMQLAATVDARRLVLTAGNFSVIDVFDRNSVTWDPRQTFFNMAFMTHASWDFPADARGYSYGATAEMYWDAWAMRLGRMIPPVDPNTQAVDFRFWDVYGDQLEIEHDHTLLGQAGVVRLLGYRNSVTAGRFSDAIAAFQADPARYNAASCTGYNFGSGNFTAPDLCWVRRNNVKVGIGLNVEQYLTPDVGLFFRGMYSDGQTEVDAYNAADRSVSFGAVAHGTPWHRHFDVAGVGFAMSWISDVHAQYLAMGGIDNFIGDGRLSLAAEGLTEAFYSFNLARAIWLSGDYQFLWNPAYNSARGPVHILGARVHAEF
jgi:hypothetical protein